jgi:transposase
MRKGSLSHYKQDRLIEHFVAGTMARMTASLCGVNRKTSAVYYHWIEAGIFDRIFEAGGAQRKRGE